MNREGPSKIVNREGPSNIVNREGPSKNFDHSMYQPSRFPGPFQGRCTVGCCSCVEGTGRSRRLVRPLDPTSTSAVACDESSLGLRTIPPVCVCVCVCVCDVEEVT